MSLLNMSKKQHVEDAFYYSYYSRLASGKDTGDILLLSSRRQLHFAIRKKDGITCVFDGQEGVMVASRGFRNDPASYVKLTSGEEAALDAIQAAEKPEDIIEPAKQLLESFNERVF